MKFLVGNSPVYNLKKKKQNSKNNLNFLYYQNWEIIEYLFHFANVIVIFKECLN